MKINFYLFLWCFVIGVYDFFWSKVYGEEVEELLVDYFIVLEVFRMDFVFLNRVC